MNSPVSLVRRLLVPIVLAIAAFALVVSATSYWEDDRSAPIEIQPVASAPVRPPSPIEVAPGRERVAVPEPPEVRIEEPVVAPAPTPVPRPEPRVVERPAPRVAPASTSTGAMETVVAALPPSDPEPLMAPPVAAAEEPLESYREVIVTLPAETEFEIELMAPLSSRTAQIGDRVRGRIADNVEADGYFALPQGAVVAGHVVHSREGRRIGGRSELAVAVTEAFLPSGATELDALMVFAGPNDRGRDAVKIAGGAVVGAILGRAMKHRRRGEGAAMGAVIGAAAGAAVAARTPAVPAEAVAGERVGVRLLQPTEITVRIRQVGP